PPGTVREVRQGRAGGDRGAVERLRQAGAGDQRRDPRVLPEQLQGHLPDAGQGGRQGGEEGAAVPVPDLEGDRPEVRRRGRLELREVPGQPQGRGGRAVQVRGRADRGATDRGNQEGAGGEVGLTQGGGGPRPATGYTPPRPRVFRLRS